MTKPVALCRIAAQALAGMFAFLCMYVLIFSIITTTRMGKTGLDSYILRYILITLFQLTLLLGNGFMYWRLAQKLEKRDDSFLKHYLILGLQSVGLVFIFCSTPMISGWGLFGLALAALALFTAGAVYLGRSKEMFDYFGNDQYRAQCILLKKLESAE